MLQSKKLLHNVAADSILMSSLDEGRAQECCLQNYLSILMSSLDEGRAQECCLQNYLCNSRVGLTFSSLDPYRRSHKQGN